jgi:hypothetical protein
MSTKLKYDRLLKVSKHNKGPELFFPKLGDPNRIEILKITDKSFNNACDYPALIQFSGAMATPMATMACVESDFSIFRDNRISSMAV